MSKAVSGKYENGAVRLLDDVGWPEHQEVLVIPKGSPGKPVIERLAKKRKPGNGNADLVEQIIEDTEFGEGID
jgi:hypothetical protein